MNPQTLLVANELLGREVHRRFDDHGPIQVFDDGTKRYLSFGTTDEQSCQLKSAPFQLQHDYLRSMFTVLTQCQDLSALTSATVLGLGGGSLTSTLWQQLPDAQIHAVELRPAVAQVAFQYFALPRDKRLKVHVSCASDYLTKLISTGLKTDLLFSDLYLADGLNPVQQQQDFLQQSASALADNGWLVLNLWKEHRQDDQLLQLIKRLFPTVMQATTHDGNWILWASRRPALEKNQAQKRCKELQPQFGFNPWNFCKPFYRHQ